MEELTPEQKLEVENLIIEACNHNYFNGTLKYTLQQVYNAFKDDSIWITELREPYRVSFIERSIQQKRKEDYEKTLITFVNYLLKNPFKLSENKATLAIYGGFARSAFLAWSQCQKDFLDDLSLFKDDINDLDISINYMNGKDIDENIFERDVRIIIDELNEVAVKLNLAHRFTADVRKGMLVEKHIDNNCYRKGETSYKSGDFFTYLVKFISEPIKGEKTISWGEVVYLDITTHIKNDTLDADVNNLVLYYDDGFKFKLRKPVMVNNQPLTLEQVKENVFTRQFIPIELEDYSKYPTRSDCLKAVNKLYNRWKHLEDSGWKVHPDHPYKDYADKKMEIIEYYAKKIHH